MSITQIPIEILIEIFSYLDPNELLQDVKRVWEPWKDIILSTAVWKNREFNFDEIADPIKRLSEIQECVQILNIQYDKLKNLFRINQSINFPNLKELILETSDNHVDFFTEIVHRCPHLKEIALSYSSFTSDVCQILSKLSLTDIEVEEPRTRNESENLSFNDVLTSLISNQPNLENISFSTYLPLLYPSTITFILNNCPKLTLLYLYNNSDLKETFENLKSPLKLEHFHVSSDFFDDDDLENIAKNSPNLKNIYIDECLLITDKGICCVAKHCSKLEHVFIEQGITLERKPLISNASLNALSKGCPNIQELSVNQCLDIKDSGIISIIERCSQLRELNLRGCKQITDAVLFSLAQNSRLLYRVDFCRCSYITLNGVLVLLRACKGLKVLDLSSGHNIGLEMILSSNSQLKPIAHVEGRFHSHLNDLDLSNCGDLTKSNVLKLIGNCPDLTDFNISYNENIDADVDFIKMVFRYCVSLDKFCIDRNKLVYRKDFPC